MDDFEHPVNTNNPSVPAFLNGDTHVRWKLEWFYTLERDSYKEFGVDEIDIEEDGHLGFEYEEPDRTRYDILLP